MRPKVLTPRSHQVFDRRRPSRPNRVDGVGFANRNDAATLDVTGCGEVFSCSSALRSDLSRIALGIDAYKGGYGRRKCAGAGAFAECVVMERPLMARSGHSLICPSLLGAD
jgi:hypothetical protein